MQKFEAGYVEPSDSGEWYHELDVLLLQEERDSAYKVVAEQEQLIKTLRACSAGFLSAEEKFTKERDDALEQARREKEEGLNYAAEVGVEIGHLRELLAKSEERAAFLWNLANTHEAANIERQGKIEALMKDKEELIQKLKEANSRKQSACSELAKLKTKKLQRECVDYSLVPEEMLAELGLALLEKDYDQADDLESKCEEAAKYYPHVQQEIVTDSHGVKRFRQNKLVNQVVEKVGLNEVFRMEASREDQAQLAQLIGYSVSGYGSLSYALPVEEDDE